MRVALIEEGRKLLRLLREILIGGFGTFDLHLKTHSDIFLIWHAEHKCSFLCRPKVYLVQTQANLV